MLDTVKLLRWDRVGNQPTQEVTANWDESFFVHNALSISFINPHGKASEVGVLQSLILVINFLSVCPYPPCAHW